MSQHNANTSSTWYIDVQAIRDLLKTELGIRGVSQARAAEEMGLLPVSLNRFINGYQSMSGDSLVTVAKWAGKSVDSVIRRRGRATPTHKDSHEQRQMRNAAAYLKSLDFEVEVGESPVDALMRLVAELKNPDLA